MLRGQQKLFISQSEEVIEQSSTVLINSSIRALSPEIIFGKIYDYILPAFGDCPSAFPIKQVKTIDYLYRNNIKPQVDKIASNHTLKVLNNKISAVFYDMTTLYFEASDEDDLRKTGFSKDGKHQCPQIYIDLLIRLENYTIGYDIYEGHTFIPFIKKISLKFNLDQPIILADAGLLSNDNIKALETNKYESILGVRIKMNPKKLMKKCSKHNYKKPNKIEEYKANFELFSHKGSKETFIATGIIIPCMGNVSRLTIYSNKFFNINHELNIWPLVLAAFLDVFIGNRLLKKIPTIFFR